MRLFPRLWRHFRAAVVATVAMAGVGVLAGWATSGFTIAWLNADRLKPVGYAAAALILILTVVPTLLNARGGVDASPEADPRGAELKNEYWSGLAARREARKRLRGPRV